ncbi:alpha/beta hydrolase [Cecembia calidifontis]|jgi:acetyl esterase/lipase|uniref:Acetyl esterase/lipase n=1 Tax=Cecembia calidifontis TaxID=1187080 RepID=A0A4Q7P9E0_9BACT|nr:alpha/beta hydrolase [Cecembia calidifontis]RZS96527.1 acetyl esterase/lipase [Cecembia calidifontis]
MKKLLLLSVLIHLFCQGFSQTEMELYANLILPNAKETPNEEKSEIGDDGILRISKVSKPTLTVYLPEEGKATGQGVIICPGGGYWILAAGHEGSDVAKEFAKRGISAFVLKYRLPSEDTMFDKTIGPLQDAQRAIQMVRENADEWNVNPDQVGILGFSAGGHLASTAGTHFKTAKINNPKNINLRPDFMVLVYPVVSFDTAIGHSGSSKNLLGDNSSQELLDKFSNEKHVDPNTPPTYLVHAKDDRVSIQNSYVFENALKQNNVPVETTYFETGGHGFGMINPQSDILWMDRVEAWIKRIFH